VLLPLLARAQRFSQNLLWRWCPASLLPSIKGAFSDLANSGRSQGGTTSSVGGSGSLEVRQFNRCTVDFARTDEPISSLIAAKSTAPKALFKLPYRLAADLPLPSNKPGCNLRLTQTQVAGMSFLGVESRDWKATELALAERSVVQNRSDGSGTTFAFTNSLSIPFPQPGKARW